MSEAVTSESPAVSRIREKFPDAVLASTVAIDVPTLTVDPARVLEIARFLKDELDYKLPVLCTGVDLKTELESVWHLLNINTGEFLALKTKLDRENPRVASLTPIWAGMDWHERESYDLLGIIYVDHPDLRRILLPDDWEGFPLRKDYTAID